MYSAIVVAKMPADEGRPQAARMKWQAFLGTLHEFDVDAPNPAVVRLGENTWQIDVRQAPGTLARLVHACERHQVAYGILPLADAPQWLPAGFDPRPSAGHNEEPLEPPDDDA
jgi:hypothetical protein